MKELNLRKWISILEQKGLLKNIEAEVDWRWEIGALTRKILERRGPALLFNNIKDYNHSESRCRRVLTNSLASEEMVALALGLPPNCGNRDIVVYFKEGFKKRLKPEVVENGPVKDNVVTGEKVDLRDFPVPQWDSRDGGRYINTLCGVVTADPETGELNIGTYRGMIGKDGKTIPSLLVATKHWGKHFTKYTYSNEKMPVAVIHGADPLLMMLASAPVSHPGASEYDIVGGMRGEALKLVKCESNDLLVPASAEIVIEGYVSPHREDFENEGPYGEYPGWFAGETSPKPTIKVTSIMYQNNPVFRGLLAGSSPGSRSEISNWIAATKSAAMWQYLEDIGITGITGVWGSPVTHAINLRVQIRKQFVDHARRIAFGIWANAGVTDMAKNVFVVEEDIDIFSDEAMEWAMAHSVNAAMGDIYCVDTGGSLLDPSTPLELRDVAEYGQGRWRRVLIDGTINWDHKKREIYGGKRYPDLATKLTPEIEARLKQRWEQYGIDG